MSRPQRQGRTSVSYKEDRLDEDFGIQQGAQEVMEQTRSKRTLALKRSSRTQDRANPKDRAEAKQLERAITESLNSSCVKTYSRVGLERSARIPNQNSSLQTEGVELDGGVASREPSHAFQVLVDAASADNSTMVDVESIGAQANTGACSPRVKQQVVSTFDACPVEHVTGKACAAEASEDLQQFNEVAAAAARCDGPEEKWDNEEAGCSESESEAEEPATEKKANKRNIGMNNSDDDEWSAEDDGQSDEDDEDLFVEDSDDSDGGKGGVKKKRRTVKPAAKKPPLQTLRRGVSSMGPSLKHSSPKQTFSRSPKEPLKRQKPASLGQENVTPATGAKVAGQDNHTAKRSRAATAKVTPESPRSVQADYVSVPPASKGLQQHPRRLPLKSLHTMSTTKTSISPPTPGSGPPLQFPSTQHRRVLGLSKRFQPPPLHPYLHGT